MGRKIINTKFNKISAQKIPLTFPIAQLYYDETNNQLLLEIARSTYETFTKCNIIARVLNHQDLIDLSLTTKREYTIIIPFYNSILFALGENTQITLPTL